MKMEQKVIEMKSGLLNLAQQLRNVSKTCKVLGYSRDSFYRHKQLYKTADEEALRKISRRKPVTDNQVKPDVEEAVRKWALERPNWGQVRVSDEMRRAALTTSLSGVRCVWQRYDSETMQKRLKALEAKQAQDGGGLTEAQAIALEKGMRSKELQGEFDSEQSGYHGAQNTFYVGNHKEVERIRQQTSVDTHTKVAAASLYGRDGGEAA